VINVGEIVTDPDFAQSFTVYRSTGSFVKGDWTESTPEEIIMRGVVTVMNARELAQYPEGDRIKGAMTFYTQEALYVTRVGQEAGTSDQIMWRGEKYKIFNVAPYVDYGFYCAAGERIQGS
jgi:hypothetical protein